MRKAVVLAARQENGFLLCKELLEQGYSVYAFDHSEWQNEEHEEKSLFLGRNANLHYDEMDHALTELKQLDEQELFVFIPFIDYYVRDYPEVKQHFIQVFNQIIEQKQEATYILIHPSSVRVNQSPFYTDIESIIKKIRPNKVREYFLSSNSSKQLFNQQTPDERYNQLHGNWVKKVAEVIDLHE